MMKKLLICLVLVLTGFAACTKKDAFDPVKQAQLDEEKIKEFLAQNNLTMERHPKGIYYQILNPGSGAAPFNANTSVTVKYNLRLLSGQAIPQTTDPISFYLGDVIAGWQIGVPLIRKGGKVRLLIPSGYAYGPQAQGNIPANSVLDFDIELIDIRN